MISLASLLAALLSLATHNVMAEVAEEEQRMGQDLIDTEMSLDQVDTVEGFMKTREFKVR